MCTLYLFIYESKGLVEEVTLAERGHHHGLNLELIGIEIQSRLQYLVCLYIQVYIYSYRHRSILDAIKVSFL